VTKIDRKQQYETDYTQIEELFIKPKSCDLDK